MKHKQSPDRERDSTIDERPSAARSEREGVPRRRIGGHDEVTEASMESFPASDPPAFNQAGRRKHRAERSDSDEGPTGAEPETPEQAIEPQRPSTEELHEARPDLENAPPTQRDMLSRTAMIAAAVLLVIAVIWIILT